jgi:DNA-binding transcriptional ArsR family regulator
MRKTVFWKGWKGKFLAFFPFISSDKMIKRCGYFLLALGAVLILARISFAQTQEYNTTYTIEIYPDGSATWTVEYRFHLETLADEEYFQEYISEFENQKIEYLENFSDKMNALVERASIVTGRSMGTKNFLVSLGILDTVTGKYGVIRYQFDWIGFAKLEEESIVIGDVFEGGLYLSKDDALIMKYPSSHAVDTVSPQPDDIREKELELIWYGRRDFGSGEPRATLQLKPTAIPTLLIVVGTICALLVLAGAFTLKRRRAREAPEERPPIEEITKSDEDRIVDLLRGAGGALYQSDLVKMTGFSKSKTSAVLSSLREKGIIDRAKRGRKNLITLKPQAD